MKQQWRKPTATGLRVNADCPEAHSEVPESSPRAKTIECAPVVMSDRWNGEGQMRH